MKINQPFDKVSVSSLRTLIYGSPGSWKTSTAMTAENSILYDFDEGIHRVSPGYRSSYIESSQLRNWDDVISFIDSPDALQFKTHVFDTVGELLNYLAEHCMAENPRLRKTDGTLSMQGWGVLKLKFKDFVSKLKARGLSVIFVAHDKEAKEDEQTIIRPDIQGSSLGLVMRVCDLVGYMQVKGKNHVICFSPTENFYGKNSANLPDVIEIPDKTTAKESFMDGIYEQYRDAVNKKTETMVAYDALLEDMHTDVDAIETVEQAQEVMDKYSGHEPIGVSKLAFKRMLADKIKAMGIKWDKESSKFILA